MQDQSFGLRFQNWMSSTWIAEIPRVDLGFGVWEVGRGVQGLGFGGGKPGAVDVSGGYAERSR